MKLQLPIYHLGYFKNLVNVLKMVCKNCCRVMMAENVKIGYLRKMKGVEKNYFSRLALWKKIFKEVSKTKVCPNPNCQYLNPSVQKIPKICAKIEVKSEEMYFFIKLCRKKEMVDGKIRRALEEKDSKD